ncbi:MAG: leucine-rich repeat domain-containing protein [Lachnospiraceae bacterium]|nr:leucine-rich repeat domain-containing protein [Lachnospiraceae bacterium]
MQAEEEALFQWEEVRGKARITGCTRSLRLLVIPEQIAGLPVVQIGDYAFKGMQQLGEVRLPSGIEFLGDHVFFNCIGLEKLSAYDKISHVGDGAFKNCDHLSEIVLHVKNDHASALRLLISDVMQDVRADILYEEKKTRLMFPAFYFDYIENYPARIFEEVIYGAGQAYRQCFRGGDVDYEAYDRLFERSGREDAPQAVLQHALGRLVFPYRLSDERKTAYETWLSEHGLLLLKECMKRDVPEEFESALSFDLFDEIQTKKLLEAALQEKNAVFINLLMAYQGRRFAPAGKSRRKKYEL